MKLRLHQVVEDGCAVRYVGRDTFHLTLVAFGDRKEWRTAPSILPGNGRGLSP